ncbi:lactate dehydrogenase [Verrucomicrobia bacterium]|nr:lactate dehydrogenase [Verrucomicrobiota bacterium]
MKKALITTVPFAKRNRLSLKLIEDAGIEYIINPHNRKPNEKQLIELVDRCDYIIAGTEKISNRVMQKAANLKLISRVGVGLDGVDLIAAKKNNINVSYTPDAPTPAVVELTIGLMFSLLRSIHVANLQLHRDEWERIFGKRIFDVKIGIIGVGRIGTGVLRTLGAIGVKTIYVNDLKPKENFNEALNLIWENKEQIYKEADIISLHLPLTNLTKNMIQRGELLSMKKKAMIINTSRGGIVNEDDLYDVMKEGHLSGVALDVYEEEPYAGKLKEIDRCLLTAHMGSMTTDCRSRMEIEAVEEVVRHATGQPLKNLVPQFEYDMQAEKFNH